MPPSYVEPCVPQFAFLLLILSFTGGQACYSKEHDEKKRHSAITIEDAGADPEASGAAAIVSSAHVSPAVSASAAAPVRTARSLPDNMLTGVYSDGAYRRAYLFQSTSKLVGCFSLTEDDTECEGDFEAFKSTPLEGETFRYGPKPKHEYGVLPPDRTAFSDAEDEDGEYLLDVNDANCGAHARGRHHLKRIPGTWFPCSVTRNTTLEIANRDVYDDTKLKLKPGQRLQAFNCDPSLEKKFFVRVLSDVNKVGYVARADLACENVP